MRPTIPLSLAVLALAFIAACADDPKRHAAPAIARDGAVDVDIVFAGEDPALTLAAHDLAEVLAQREGATRRAPNQTGAGSAVVVVVDATADLDPEGFELIARHRDRPELEVRARTPIGAAYGLWSLAKELGARWFHPEDEAFIRSPGSTLPWPETPSTDKPDFALRGFHEHTQHPTVASDIFLRPDFAGGREAVSRQLRWLARNRQNLLTVHFLSTVDLATWTPFMADIAAEARGLGVAMGVVIGFTDQQQHAFRLVRADLRDDQGEPIPPEQQIRDGLDRVLASGIDHVVFQIGTSEFTAPDPAITVASLDAAVDHIVSEHPRVTPHAWIHITCNLLTEEGKDFFHTPLQADPALGAWVHTTMFYTLRDPAPVYDCEDFTHQLDFLEQAQGQREQTFFPESAWWLGFDNNLPLLLPITGVSRERDIADIQTFGVTGHVTFTTGREHLYWMYDHYVAWAAWDADLTWSAYLDLIAPIWGAHAAIAAGVLNEWTGLQVRDLYETHPEIFFYLAGELPQDEVGVLAGVIARRPKLALKTVRDYDDATFSQWKTRDYDLLLSMREDYAGLVSKLPAASPRTEGEATADRLYREVHRAASIHLQRIEHALAIYGGVIAARANDRTLAEQRLSEARALSEAARQELVRAESDYRDPIEWLARLKPESLTVYPFGYLYETSTAYFWTRRDDQLANLISATFDGVAESWPNTPLAVFFAERETTTLTAPSSEVAAGIIVGLVPRVLVAISAVDTDAGVVTLQLATDHNKNGLPDEEPLTLSAVLTGTRLTATAPTWVLPVRDAADELLGRLVLRDSELLGELVLEGGTPTALPSLELTGEVLATDLITMVQSVAGIDRAGIENLMKDIWQLDPTQPLPARLPFGLALSPTPAP